MSASTEKTPFEQEGNQVASQDAIEDSQKESSEHVDVSIDEELDEELDEKAEADDEQSEQAEGEESTTTAEEQIAQWQDRYLRLQAEWDNYRKRTAQEREQEKMRATEKLINNLLQVVDDMERAIDTATGSEDDPMLCGIKAVHNKLCSVLGREGLEAIDPKVGDAFDINLHQAVSTVEDSEMPQESINQIYQKGYILGGKILRPAMVVVTTGGPSRE